MFQDVELSRECLAAYQLHLQTATESNGSVGSGHEPEMSVQVLTTGYWPTTVTAYTTSFGTSGDVQVAAGSILIPPELKAPMIRFNTYYTSKYQGRRLCYAHSLERCVVAARFPKGRKDLEVSMFQVNCLLNCCTIYSITYRCYWLGTSSPVF